MFVDDALWAVPLENYWQEESLALLLPWILGVPISWNKTVVVLEAMWVRFFVNLKDITLGISSARLAEACAIAQGRNRAGRVGLPQVVKCGLDKF